MRALFTSINLIGDGLCISAALRAWHRQNPECEIDLLTDTGVAAELYKGMGVPLRVIFEPTEHEEHNGVQIAYKIDYAFYFTFDVNKAFAICDQKKCHLAQGYADLLGVTIGENAADLGPFYDPPYVEEDTALVESIPQGTILLAPFSRSCASHDGKPPNKCLPWAKWKRIVEFLRKTGHPIRVTGGPNDRADALGFSEEEYLAGFPLRPLARAMKEGRIHVMLSVDNGLSHLAGSQKQPQILYYPMCLGLHYAVPWSNPNVVPIHIDPALVDPAQLLWSTKQAYGMIENQVYEKREGTE